MKVKKWYVLLCYAAFYALHLQAVAALLIQKEGWTIKRSCDRICRI